MSPGLSTSVYKVRLSGPECARSSVHSVPDLFTDSSTSTLSAKEIEISTVTSASPESSLTNNLIASVLGTGRRIKFSVKEFLPS